MTRLATNNPVFHRLLPSICCSRNEPIRLQDKLSASLRSCQTELLRLGLRAFKTYYYVRHRAQLVDSSGATGKLMENSRETEARMLPISKNNQQVTMSCVV